MARGVNTEQEAPYGLGELDLAPRSGSLELDVAPLPSARPDNDGSLDGLDLPAPPQSSPAFVGGAVIDDDDSLWADLPALELAHDPRAEAAPTTVRRPSLTPPSSERPAERVSSKLPEPAAPERLAPLAALPELGPVPSALWHTPRYAVTAARYAIALFRRSRALEREQTEAARQFDEALVELGRALLEQRSAPELAQLKAKFLSVDEQRAQRDSVSGALREVRESRVALDTALEAELTRIGHERTPYVERAHSTNERLSKAEAELARAEAQLKRAEIALRAAKQAVSLPAGTRLDELEAGHTRQQAERDRLAAVRAEAKAEAERARADLDAKDSEERAERARHAQRAAEVDKRSSAIEKRISLIDVSENAALKALGVTARNLQCAGLARAQAEHAEKCARLLAGVELDVLKAREARGRIHMRSVTHGAAILLALGVLLVLALR
jgi:hypothetical protein